MYVNFKGTLGNYFLCKRGLRQGDPLSPFLFDLVAEALNKILKKTQAERYLDLFKGKVLNLHFADDTLIFLKADSAMIKTL